MSVKRIKWYVSFSAWSYPSSKDSIWDYYNLIGHGQLYFSSNQIAGFCHYQYLRKQSLDILSFLHGDSYQENVASEATVFDWVWLGLSFLFRHMFLTFSLHWWGFFCFCWSWFKSSNVRFALDIIMKIDRWQLGWNLSREF